MPPAVWVHQQHTTWVGPLLTGIDQYSLNSTGQCRLDTQLSPRLPAGDFNSRDMTALVREKFGGWQPAAGQPAVGPQAHTD